MAQIRIEGVAKEGDGVGRGADGRVVFVRGALAGELVDAQIVDERASFCRAVTTAVVEPHSQRRDPPCPSVAEGCGGCDLQHADEHLQRDMQLRIVADALERIGRLDVEPSWGGGIESFGYRTTVRAIVHDGVAGFRRHRSHDAVPAVDCLISHELVREVLAESRFGRAREVVVRASRATGERIVAVDPRAGEGIVVPDGVTVVGADTLGRTNPSLTEIMDGRRWRVSISSFLQASPSAADLLAAAVRSSLDHHAGATERIVDLFSGVGLLAAAVGALAGEVVAVESNRWAVQDARHNLADLDHVRVVRRRVEDWTPLPADAVIADPPRQGLRAAGVETVVACAPETVVLVSCDAAAGARDLRLLTDRGYQLHQVEVLDLFPQTTHLEVVSTLTR